MNWYFFPELMKVLHCIALILWLEQVFCLFLTSDPIIILARCWYVGETVGKTHIIPPKGVLRFHHVHGGDDTCRFLRSQVHFHDYRNSGYKVTRPWRDIKTSCTCTSCSIVRHNSYHIVMIIRQENDRRFTRLMIIIRWGPDGAAASLSDSGMEPIPSCPWTEILWKQDLFS